MHAGEIPGDLQQVVAFVQALLEDSERLDRMSPVEHLRWARTLPGSSEPQAPEHLKLAMARILQLSPVEAQESRAAAVRHWEERKRVLDPEWERLFWSLPEHLRSVLGPKKNLLLLAELLAAAHHPDSRLIEHLLQGFPLVGRFPRSGTLPPMPYTATTETAQSLWAKRHTQNTAMRHRAQRTRFADNEMKEEFLRKIHQEVRTGKAEWKSLRLALDTAVLTPRFIVDEGYKRDSQGHCRRKIRMIDDFLASLVNAAASVGERIQHDHLDVLVSLARQIGHGRLRFRKCDFSNAFKTLPLRNEELFLAVSAFLGEDGQVWALQLLSCPFGAIGSVHAWHRFGAAIQNILANVFAIAYPRYVDDLFGLDVAEDSQGAADTAALSNWIIEDLLGWELDSEKAESNVSKFRALGVDIAIDEAEAQMIFCIGEDKAEKWKEQITEVLQSERLTPAEASKLAGKLSWGATAVFGRGARVYLAPLFFHAAGCSSWMPGRLQRALQWWLRYLEAVPVRILNLKPVQRSRLLLYTDATGDGVMAWVAEYGNSRRYSSVLVPKALRRWVCYRKNQIATWELAAAICGLWQFLAGAAQIVDGTEIHLFVDNNVALGTLMRGSSRQKDWNELVTDIWFQTAAHGFLLLCWRVPSKQNLADAPTRPEERTQELMQLHAAGFRKEMWQWPPIVPWQ